MAAIFPRRSVTSDKDRRRGIGPILPSDRPLLFPLDAFSRYRWKSFSRESAEIRRRFHRQYAGYLFDAEVVAYEAAGEEVLSRVPLRDLNRRDVGRVEDTPVNELSGKIE